METNTLREKPVQWTASSSVFTRVLELIKWFVFNTFQDLFFYFKFSVENISYDRNPMQHMDGFWQDQGAP